MENLKYPTTEELLQIHNHLIKMSLEETEVGSYGFLWWRNESDLQSVLTFIKNNDYYPTLADKLTQFMFAINKNHLFKDGNKRSSIYFPWYLLYINRCNNIEVSNFIRSLEDVSVLVASNSMNKDELRQYIKEIIPYTLQQKE